MVDTINCAYSCHRQVEDQREDMSSLQERQRDLLETIRSLEKDIQVKIKQIQVFSRPLEMIQQSLLTQVCDLSGGHAPCFLPSGFCCEHFSIDLAICLLGQIDGNKAGLHDSSHTVAYVVSTDAQLK